MAALSSVLANHNPVSLAISQTQCMSIKSKKDFSRCPHSVKAGDILCGIHQRAKNVQLFQLENGSVDTAVVAEPIPAVNDRAVETTSAPTSVSVSMAAPASIERVGIVRDPTKCARKIQQWIRGIWKARCNSCCNDADFISFEKLVDIPYPLVYFHRLSSTNVLQGYDIRSLLMYIRESLKENPTKPIKNPYTCETFSNGDIASIQNRSQVLRLDANTITREEIPLNPESQFQQYVLSIFQKMDFLDNYTNMDWFMSLSISQLKKLYFAFIDIWAYRAQLPHNAKCRIVRNGFAFPVHEIIVKRMPENEKNKRHIQKIILAEFDRFISEGQTREDKKLGCMFVLTALVEISPDAAAALPQYVQ